MSQDVLHVPVAHLETSTLGRLLVSLTLQDPPDEDGRPTSFRPEISAVKGQALFEAFTKIMSDIEAYHIQWMADNGGGGHYLCGPLEVSFLWWQSAGHKLVWYFTIRRMATGEPLRSVANRGGSTRWQEMQVHL